LQSFAQEAQAFRSFGIVISISTILVFVPTSSNAEVEPPMREHINSTGHFRQQCWMAIAVARDHLTNADTLCVTCKSCGGGPTLKGDFLRWLWDSMEMIHKPGRLETDFVSGLGHSRHRLVSLNGVLDTHQIHDPT